MPSPVPQKTIELEPGAIGRRTGSRAPWAPPLLAPLVALLLIALIAAGGAALGVSRFTAARPEARVTDRIKSWVTGWFDKVRRPAPVVVKPVARRAVTALGRLEPQGEVTRLSAPAFLKDERVRQVLVKVGDRVLAGQVVCVLDSRDRLLAALKEGHEQVRIAEGKLARVQAGAKRGEIEAQRMTLASLRFELANKLDYQQAEIARLEASFQFHQRELERYSQLHADGAISASLRDSKQLGVSTARALLNQAIAEQARIRDTLMARIQEATATLKKISEVRDVDVRLAQAELEAARARIDRLAVESDLSCVRAPFAGRVLKVHVRPGEEVTDRGIADIGRTDRMVAVAEIYQTDIVSVRLGQRATITGDGFNGLVHGTVSQIGWEVTRQRVFAQDPTSTNDRRVIETQILIDVQDSLKVAKLTNMQVQVSIEI
jgi:HlyD family secretion protein